MATLKIGVLNHITTAFRDNNSNGSRIFAEATYPQLFIYMTTVGFAEKKWVKELNKKTASNR